MEQRHYVGLDVSLDLTSICVVDEAGAIVWRGKCASEPDAIGHAIRAHSGTYRSFVSMLATPKQH